MCWVSGHGEGWALYAERLMDELGYLDDPGDKLGMLDGQGFRAARVIVDIGMHLELEIPRDNPFGFHPGETWTPELGLEFMRAALPDGGRVHPVRGEPLPRLAGPGSVVQGRRADLAAGPRGRPGPARQRLRPQVVPPLRARPRARSGSTRCRPRWPASRDPAGPGQRVARAAGDAAVRRARPRGGGLRGRRVGGDAPPTRRRWRPSSRRSRPGRSPRDRARRRRGRLRLGARASTAPCTASRRDAAEAVARWRSMRGRSGVLHTGHCVIAPAARRGACGPRPPRCTSPTSPTRRSTRTSRPASRCRWPARSPIDGLGGAFVRGIEGDHHTVVGISLPLLREMLAEVDVAWVSPLVWTVPDLGCRSCPQTPRPYPRVLAVVPAFNEEESVGRTIEELTGASTPASTSSSSTTGPVTTRPGSPGGPVPRLPAALQPRRRRRHARRLPLRAAPRLRRGRPGGRGRPARPDVPEGTGRRARHRRHRRRRPVRRRGRLPRPRSPALGDAAAGRSR